MSAADGGGGGGGASSLVVDHATLTRVAEQLGRAGSTFDSVGTSRPGAGGTGQAEPLLLMILAGPDGVAVVEKVAGRAGAHQGRRLVGAIPIAGIQRINRLLGPNTVTKYGTKQGILVLGKVETRTGDRDNAFRFNGFDPLAAQVGRDRRSQHEPDVPQRLKQTPRQVVAGPNGTDDDAIPTAIEPGEQQSVETLGRVENRRRIALDTAAQCTQV